ncbi:MULTISPECIES: conjugal transfer protein TraD [unclassified Bradyrhizobium]|uniref:conjugal transfer protein TraD n=1 Tax=unclassified Bradyrhizobium TaxID=2631580 RepID=UPI00291648FC|nr:MULTISPECIES: conjugal transfer protein TraD [unclassified Bradyrhizobium]
MRARQVERRKRTRHLIELGGLVAKAGIVDLIGDDRATILGAMLWMADKLQGDQGETARKLWAAKGKQAFEAAPATHNERNRALQELIEKSPTRVLSAPIEGIPGKRLR